MRHGTKLRSLAHIILLVTLFSPQGSNLAWGKVPFNTILNEDGNSLIADIAELRIDGVVNISSTKVIQTGNQPFLNPFFSDPFFREFFGNRFYGIPRERRERSLGSGVIVSEDGLVLTNNHVVENADEILVTLTDKRELEAELVGTDPKSDVAVIRLKGDIKDLSPIPLGNSAKLRLGDIVLAIGNPFGLDHTVTMGIVSAKGRANVGITDYEDFIQTDAAINPGNSGGALVNLQGELVGINTAILSKSGGYQGIGFAIPSNMAKGVMESLVKYGKVVRGWLGVVVQDLDTSLAEAMEINNTNGVLIADIAENSPAGKAKLKRGDIILRINDEKMSSSDRFRNTIATLGAGAEIKMDVWRDGKKMHFSLILSELPDTFRGQAIITGDYGVLGELTIAPLNSLTREKYEIDKRVQSGVVIIQIEAGSTAERAGLNPGDVILEINRNQITTVQEFEDIYRNTNGQLLLLVYSKGRSYYLVLR